MDAIRYLSAFRLYGADVLLLALGVTLLTSLLKKTVLKHVSKKIIVVLPYLLGLVVYFVYRLLVTLSLTPVTTGVIDSLEGGFAVGCAATLYYVVYEQFFRAKKGEQVGVLTPLLEGLLPAQNVQTVSDLLEKARAEQSDAELLQTAMTTLTENGVALADAELEAFARLLCAYLAALMPQ